MPSHHISLRMDDETFERLERRSKRAGQSRSRTVNTLIEEGLRMEEHPGIVFRSGPTGRRAGLAGGPDIWEIARVFASADAMSEAEVRQAADLMGLSPAQIGIALRYYAEYESEIDDWIHTLDAEAAQTEADWSRQRELRSS